MYYFCIKFITIKKRMTDLKKSDFFSFKVLLVFLLILPLSFSSYGQEGDHVEGKKLYNTYCASCHKLNKK